MAIRNKRIFGLPVVLSLADIPDRQEALLNIGLRQEDLENIRGISENGFDTNDLQTLSNLSSPIWKTFDRYISDVTRYNSKLSLSAGSDIITRGNVEVVGPILSTAFRYTLLDTISNPTLPVLRWGDISTSRVSSWSSVGDTIAYGADVSISGKLSVGNLKTTNIPIRKQFPAEQITHKIKIDLNGTIRYIYAMKGIPIRFTGFFRNLDASITLNTSSAPPTAWRLYTVGTTNFEDYADSASSRTSTLTYRSPSSRNINIELYANPANIESFTLENSNILELPRTRLINCLTFNFQNNGLVNLPDFEFLVPNANSLRLNNNRFFNGSDPKLRYFGRETAEKFPTTVSSLSIDGCFLGAFFPNILNRFTNLRTIAASRSSLNTSAIFYKTTGNDTGSLPNFYGDASVPLDSSGVNSSHQIRNIYFVDQRFETISNGLQGGVDAFVVTGGGNNTGSGYTPGKYSNVLVTPVGAAPNTGVSVEFSVVSTGQVNPSSIKVNNPGIGGNTLSHVYTIPGTTGTQAEIQVSKLVYTQNIKQQSRIINLDLNSNVNLVDTNFSLSCPSSLETLNIRSTGLYVPQLTEYKKLTSIDFTFGFNRGSFYDGWDGNYDSPNRPVSDVDRFKFLNCSSLRTINGFYSDISGYIPKFIGCPELRTLNLDIPNVVNRIISGRPAKRGIQRLFLNGAINTIGTFTVTGTIGEFQPNIQREVEDKNPPVGGVPARFIVTTNNTGNVINVTLNENFRGSKYTQGYIATISGVDLEPPGVPSSGNRNVQVPITSVISAIEGDATYPSVANTTQTFTDTEANTQYGSGAQVSITFNSIGAVESYEIVNGGIEYKDFEFDRLQNEFFTVSAAQLGGTNDLKIKIQRVEPPRLLYNDTFEQNPLLETIDIRINSVNYRGEAEPNCFLPCKNNLRILRFQAAGRATGSFPNLNDHPALVDSYSIGQGWSGPIPDYTNSFNMSIIRHSGNNFSGQFYYINKVNCYYIDYTSNKLTSFNPNTRLPRLQFLFLGNNLIGSEPDSNTLPVFSDVCPIIETIDMNTNRLALYRSGLEVLPRLRVLDLSNNQMPTGTVDSILFALEKNYLNAPRTGVSVNLRGPLMGAPTPYPIVTGVISSVTSNSSVVISNGDVIDLKDAISPLPGYVPVSGTYNNVNVQYNDGSGPGSGATLRWTVVSNFTPNIIRQINTSGFVQTGNIAPEISGTFSLTDTQSGTSNGSGARVSVTVTNNGPGNPSTISSITLINGGSNYRIGEELTFNLTSIPNNPNPGSLIVVITDVKKRTYTNVSWSATINNGGSNYSSTSAEQMKTSDVIIFENEDGARILGYINFRVNATTQFTNTSVKTGFAVAQFLRQRGWSVQTN